MLIGGLKILKNHKPMASSKWFGKIGTFIFYCATIIIIATTNIISKTMVLALVIFVAVYMLFAFIMYVPLYFKIKHSSEDVNI
jgi:cardiolipin synthase